MAEFKKMAWAQYKLEIGKTGTNDAMAEQLTTVPRLKEKTAQLNSDLGTPLEAYESGHKLIDREYPDETLTLEVTVIEPDDTLLNLLGIGAGGKVTSHVVDGFFSIVLTPKHKDALGIKAPKCKITYSPQLGEETGNEAVLSFEITKTSEDWYEIFQNPTELV